MNDSSAPQRHITRPLDKALYDACSAGTLEQIRELLDRGANPNAPFWDDWLEDVGPEDYYPIHRAAENPDIRILDLLVEHGANPNKEDFYWRQPLSFAARTNRLEIVQRLIELGNDPTHEDADALSVLAWSSANPDVRICELILSLGADINEGAIGSMPLEWAAKYGTPDRIRFFLAHGADMNNLSWGVSEAPIENLCALLDAGFDPGSMCDWLDDSEWKEVFSTLAPERKIVFEQFGRHPR